MEIYQVKIEQIIPLTDEIFEFRLSRPEGVHWTPGAHMHVGLPGFRDGAEPDKGLVRHMSVYNTQEQGYLSFVTRIPAQPSRFKEQLSEMKEGDSLSVFKLGAVLRLMPEQPMVFISMGIGMAAFAPMLTACTQQGLGRQSRIVSLSVARPEEQVFRTRLEALQAPEIELCWAQSRAEFLEALQALLRRPELSQAHYYVVGSDEFIRAQIGVLLAAGVEASRIILDKKEEKRIGFFE